MRILGAPYGEYGWCRQWLKEHGDGVQETLDAIVGLSAHDNTNAAQAAFLLLRFSASTKVSHLLRMVPPTVMSTAAQRHDDAVASCLSLLLDRRRDPLQRRVPSGRRQQGGDERGGPRIKWTSSASMTSDVRRLSLSRGIIAYTYEWPTS